LIEIVNIPFSKCGVKTVDQLFFRWENIQGSNSGSAKAGSQLLWLAFLKMEYLQSQSNRFTKLAIHISAILFIWPCEESKPTNQSGYETKIESL
jgi:hypothetical protein